MVLFSFKVGASTMVLMPLSSLGAMRESGSWTRLGEGIDRLVTIEFRPGRDSVPPGLVAPLYQVCRLWQGAPLSTSAAEIILKHARSQPVLIVTGAGTAPILPEGETDGPPGAVALMQAVREAVDAHPIVVTEQAHARAVSEGLATAGINEDSLRLFPRVSREESVWAAERLIADTIPAVIVFIERDGANKEGRYHGVRGNCRPAGSVAGLDALVDVGSAKGVPVIAIGDGGNEVGFGAMREEVQAIFPDGAVCQDGCASGRITSVCADIAVSAGISNWGAYGVSAAIAAATGTHTALIDPDMGTGLIDACLRGGALDGALGQATRSVDGVGVETNRAILVLLHELVRMSQL